MGRSSWEGRGHVLPILPEHYRVPQHLSTWRNGCEALLLNLCKSFKVSYTYKIYTISYLYIDFFSSHVSLSSLKGNRHLPCRPSDIPMPRVPLGGYALRLPRNEEPEDVQENLRIK